MPLPRQILLATHNRDKIRELLPLLREQGLEALTPYDLEQPYPDPEETGRTYLDNALLKARAAALAAGLPALGEDTGFEVLALGGKPGLHSKRWYGEEGDEEARNRKILELLRDAQDRRARYVTALALVDPQGNLLATGQGELPGEVLTEPSREGFAYDRIFAVQGRPLSELSLEEKNRISQRRKALQDLLRQLLTEKSAAVRLKRLPEPVVGNKLPRAANQLIIRDSDDPRFARLKDQLLRRHEQFIFDDYVGRFTRILDVRNGLYYAVPNKLLPLLIQEGDRPYYLAPSPLHGLGTFASLPFHPGAPIDTTLVYLGKRDQVDLYGRTALGRFVNMQPPEHRNVTLERIEEDLFLVPTRPIRPGEELLTGPYTDELLPYAPAQVVLPTNVVPLQ